MSKPTVSIVVLAYNLEKYIGECIESLVEQKFEHPFEIVIGEDCSTDNTKNICLAWQQKKPDLIRVLDRKSNLGMSENFADVVKECRGEFIAFCEGDDYWNNPLKLKLQHDYFSSHPNVGLVYTNFNVVDENRKIIPKLNRKLPEGKILKNLLEYSFIATVTVMARKEIICKAIEERKDLIIGNGKAVDYPLWLTCATLTEIGYLNVVTATYRVMKESASHSRDMEKQIAYQTVNKNIALIFQEQYFPGDEKLKKTIYNTYYYSIMKEAIRANDKKYVLEFYRLLIKNDPKKLFNAKINFFLLKGLVDFQFNSKRFSNSVCI